MMWTKKESSAKATDPQVAEMEAAGFVIVLDCGGRSANVGNMTNVQFVDNSLQEFVNLLMLPVELTNLCSLLRGWIHS